jgi:hypothetical protein
VGGAATVENIELRCRAHNAYEARLFFGPDVVREGQASWGVLVPEQAARSCGFASQRITDYGRTLVLTTARIASVLQEVP